MHTNKADMPQSTSATAIKYLGAKQYQLSMEGRFDPGWVCGLSHGLSARRINIVRVEAAKGTGRNWQSQLDLDFSTTLQAPDTVDYLALSRSHATVQAFAEPVMLDDYQLESSTRCAGSLYVEASGPDRLGMLSSLLNTFSLFSLFPSEMLVETRNKRIFDRFWLKGMGGSRRPAKQFQPCEAGCRSLCSAESKYLSCSHPVHRPSSAQRLAGTCFT